jgi:hypothetical protein
MRRTLADVVFFGGVTTCFALAGYRIYFVWGFDWGAVDSGIWRW